MPVLQEAFPSSVFCKVRYNSIDALISGDTAFSRLLTGIMPQDLNSLYIRVGIWCQNDVIFTSCARWDIPRS